MRTRSLGTWHRWDENTSEDLERLRCMNDCSLPSQSQKMISPVRNSAYVALYMALLVYSPYGSQSPPYKFIYIVEKETQCLVNRCVEHLTKLLAITPKSLHRDLRGRKPVGWCFYVDHICR